MTRLALLEATGRLFVAGFDWPLAMLGLAARVLAATLAARHGPDAAQGVAGISQRTETISGSRSASMA